MFTLYKIYFGETLAYLGRTRQPLNQRLHGHFFKKKFHKTIDIFKVTKIESAGLLSCADMYLYEIYYLNKLHPILNKNDIAADNLTVELPELIFTEYDCRLMEKWRMEYDSKMEEYEEKKKERREKRREARLAAEAMKNASNSTEAPAVN